MEDVVIIGNGIAGTTAARHIRKLSNKKITIISGEAEYFFSRTALMYVYMGHMKFEQTQPYENSFWKKNNINLVQAYVSHINTANNYVELDDKTQITYDTLIIATGSQSNKFGWPGQHLKGVTSFYHKQDLETIEQFSTNCKRAVVVGGGLIGIELAEMFISRNIPVSFLVRENSFWGNIITSHESSLIANHIIEHGIDLQLNTSLQEIVGTEDGTVKGIITSNNQFIECTIVGITVGVSPNIQFLKSSNIATAKGVLVNRFLQTNIKNIYAIGDCAEQHEPINSRRTVEAVWYTGRMMGETIAQTICGYDTQYMPGHWFNSAKFLDIEYQTYGWVWATPNENEEHWHWQHPLGKKSITIAYEKNTHTFLGINALGIRLKHLFFDTAFNECRTVEYIITNFNEACFDPELFTNYTSQIQQAFFNTTI